MVDYDKLEKLHASGYNCAQCVAAYYADKTGMDVKTALAATGGFGSGFRCGDICGAASAGVMVLGLLYPYNDCNKPAAKSRIMGLASEFEKRFKKRYGYLDCRDLKSKGKTPCIELIKGAVEIVDEMTAK